MIETLIGLLLLLVLIYVAKLVVDELPLPGRIKTVVYIIIGLIFLVILLDKLGVYHLSLK